MCGLAAAPLRARRAAPPQRYPAAALALFGVTLGDVSAARGRPLYGVLRRGGVRTIGLRALGCFVCVFFAVFFRIKELPARVSRDFGAGDLAW